MSESIELLAEQVAAALAAGDPQRFADLLDPQVTWGAPGDTAPPCRTREQVLSWYRQGRAAGRRASVRSVSAVGEKILVALSVTSARAAGGEQVQTPRWQVLTVADGRIADIRGFDSEETALAAAGRGG